MPNTTESQYKRISGSFPKYFNRLLALHGRREQGLTLETLLELLKKQDGKCALSGVKMTCTLEKGKSFPENASIDKKDPKGGYAPENIQLVCQAVNKWRGDLNANCFVDFCHKVAKNNPI